MTAASRSASPRAPDLVPLGRFEWERVVRRLALGKTTKLVAFGLATYADRDGTNAHPGVDRLAAELECDERTVRRALVRLRGLGLLLQTHDGSSSGRRRLASEYRLTQPVDLLQRVELLPSPATYHRAPVPGDDAEQRALVPAVLSDHRAPVPGDNARITGHESSDHRALVSDHRAPVSGSPGTGARPPHMTTDVDHTKNHVEPSSGTQLTTARERCGKHGHEFSGWPCRACASEALAGGR